MSVGDQFNVLTGVIFFIFIHNIPNNYHVIYFFSVFFKITLYFFAELEYNIIE